MIKFARDKRQVERAKSDCDDPIELVSAGKDFRILGCTRDTSALSRLPLLTFWRLTDVNKNNQERGSTHPTTEEPQNFLSVIGSPAVVIYVLYSDFTISLP